LGVGDGDSGGLDGLGTYIKGGIGMSKLEEELDKGLISWIDSYKVAKKYGNRKLEDELYDSIMRKADEVGFDDIERSVLIDMLNEPVYEK